MTETTNPLLVAFESAVATGEYDTVELAQTWIGLMDTGYPFAEDAEPHRQADRNEARAVLSGIVAPDPQAAFDGLAFPVITVRLGNGKANATMATYEDTFRARLDYSYDERDGAAFAIRAAQAVWDKYAAHMATGDYPYIVEPSVFVPGNPGPSKGYVITVVPAHYFN